MSAKSIPCRVCGTPIEAFMTFGPMPIANGFLPPDRVADEYRFELAPAFCPHCLMLQIVEQPDERQMFHGEYAYFASTSKAMVEHFRAHAEQVRGRWLGAADPFVVEIGSNDGIQLRNFAAAGIRHLGIEPSANVAEVARNNGVSVTSEFFTEDLAERIVAQHGQADVFMGANVMCHIPYFHSVAAGVKRLLKPEGVMIFEDPYLGAMVEKTSYDQLYDEHVFVFSVLSVANAFDRHGMEVIDVEPLGTHGGSMRYTIANKGAHPVSPRVTEQLRVERAQGLDRAETFLAFRDNCERSKREFKAVLESLKAEGKRVVGYGATSKSTTVLNYCGVGPDLIEFISDTTPIKQGKVTPGTHIPVRPYQDFTANYPDVAVLFAWNHKAEIMAKEEGFRASGGRWLHFVPRVEITE